MGLKENRRKVAKQHLLSYTDWTSAHGVPQIGRSRHYMCIGFWSIISLIGLGLLIWQTTLLLIQYYAYDVSVRFDLKFAQRSFPAVTICNLNPYRKDIIYKEPSILRLMETYKYTMRKVACNADPACKFVTNSTIEKLIETYRFNGIVDTAVLQNRAKRVLTLELADKNVSDATMDIKDFFQGCSFNTLDCNETLWSSFIDPLMGRCFVFNVNGEQLALRSGPTFGLRIVLKTNTSEFIATSETAGMKVLVHDQGEFPFPDVFGYNIQTGAATSLAVKFKDITRMGPPYGTCTVDKPDDILYPLNYTNEGCLRTKYQQQIISTCGCYDPAFPVPKNSTGTKPCSVADSFKFDCWLQEANNTNFDNTCAQPCREQIYDVHASAATWPSGSVTNIGECEEGMYGDKTCLDVFREQGALLEVFFEKLNYETMEESASYSIVSLLSDFGGQIGLWLGMSAISIVEVIVLLFQLCATTVSPRAGQALNF